MFLSYLYMVNTKDGCKQHEDHPKQEAYRKTHRIHKQTTYESFEECQSTLWSSWFEEEEGGNHHHQEDQKLFFSGEPDSDSKIHCILNVSI